METFLNFFEPYYVFLIPIASWFIVQGTKIIIYSIKHGWKIIDNMHHLGHGHMPSAHTGFVVSLATSVGYYSGMDSGAFAVAFVFAIITIDDSVRLRMQMGYQGKYINIIVNDLKLNKELPHLKERLGHRLSEVVVGGIYGFLLSMSFIKLLSYI